MKVRFLILFFFIISLLNCGLQVVECGSPKSGVRNQHSKILRDDAVKLFTDANEKYTQATKCIAAKNNQEASQKLHEAALQYETMLVSGFKHGQIYYNLGNTYYRQGALGKSILNYRRAQQLIPRNADVDANLRLVKNSTEDKELSDEVPVAVRRIFFWLFLLNQKELTMVVVLLYIALMALLFFSIVFKYSWLRRIIIGFSAGLFIAVVSLGIKIYREECVNHGVIITTKCQVRYGPGEEYEPKFEIHDGAECVIEDEKDDWYRVCVQIGVKQGTGSKMSTEEREGKEVQRGWLQKKNVDTI